MSGDPPGGNPRFSYENLSRLAAQVMELARRRPGDRCDGVIRIVQPRTHRASLMPGVEQELLEGALALASRGYRVLPVGAATFDDTNPSNGKVPRFAGWQNRATTDEATIRNWFGVEFPGANVGVATGASSGVTIVDLDLRVDEGKDGPAQLAALEREHGELPPGPMGRRGHGAHLHFRYVSELHTIANVLPGVDVRNDGGLIVAPPSIHRTGERYVWAPGTRDLPLPIMPPWLVAALTPTPKVRKRRERVVGPRSEPRDRTNTPIEAIRSRLAVDDVLQHYELEPTPTCCPLHGGDNPRAFTSYANDPSRWHCFTNCEDGERDGDILDLIQRLEGCSLAEAMAIALGILEPQDSEGGGAP